MVSYPVFECHSLGAEVKQPLHLQHTDEYTVR